MAFNFSNSESVLKTRHCRVKFVVEPMLKASAPWKLATMRTSSCVYSDEKIRKGALVQMTGTNH